MARRFRESYQYDGGLEQAVVDLVRVGGGGSGVRQLASRLVRTVPPAVGDPEAFRAAIHEALSESARQPALRLAGADLPTEEGTSHQLVQLDQVPAADGLVLHPTTMTELAEVAAERLRADELTTAGVGLTRTLLLSGPPGVGKTMAARWLAGEIGVPLVSVDLASVLSSYLGASGRNIRAALGYGARFPCVVLLDEFDALAKRRDDDTDIGELKRIVNVVLVELDRWSDSSLLVAATNHPQLLDPAVGRRFDRQIEFELPGESERLKILELLVADPGSDVRAILRLVADATSGMSGSDLERLSNIAKRRSVLNGSPVAEELLTSLLARSATAPERDQLWLAVSQRLKLSNRKIAGLAGVSHPTVAAALKRARGDAHV